MLSSFLCTCDDCEIRCEISSKSPFPSPPQARAKNWVKLQSAKQREAEEQAADQRKADAAKAAAGDDISTAANDGTDTAAAQDQGGELCVLLIMGCFAFLVVFASASVCSGCFSKQRDLNGTHDLMFKRAHCIHTAGQPKGNKHGPGVRERREAIAHRKDAPVLHIEARHAQVCVASDFACVCECVSANDV